MKRNKKRLRTRNGIWIERGDWTPVFVLNQQKQAGIEYQTYALDANGKLVHAGVTRHERMNRAVARQIQQVWARWRKEYIAMRPGNYPLVEAPRVVRLVVSPIGHPERAESFAV